MRLLERTTKSETIHYLKILLGCADVYQYEIRRALVDAIARLEK